MNKEMHELAAWSLEKAKAAGANACRVSIFGERFVEISYRERKPENTREASRKGLGIDVFADGRYSSQSTSDLRKESLQAFIANAVATTKLLEEDPFRTLPDAKYYKGRAEIDLDTVDDSYQAYSAEDRHELVKTVENACLERGGDKVISVTAETSDRRAESVMITSNGFEGYRSVTRYTVGAEMTAQDEGDRRPNGYHYLTVVKKSELPSLKSIGVGAAERTFDLMGGKKIKTETLPVIIENRVVARILFGLLAGMFGRSIQQKQSFLADKKGQKIASDHLTVIDDPFIKGGLGSQLYDGDGLTTKKRTMIDKGVLKEFWVDWYYSRKLGWEPTAGGPTNLVIPPGKRSVEEIMKDLGRGIFVTGFIGGNSNSTTGDASIGIIGKLFDEGKPVQSVAEMNIADNHLKFWQRLAEVGNDPWTYSQFQLPSLVFTDVVVSGI
jgi:PmbA protein